MKNHEVVLSQFWSNEINKIPQRGKTIHTAISIPWESIYEKPVNNYMYSKFIKEQLFQISDRQYKVSRNNRINELTSNLNEQEFEEIKASIPDKTLHLSLKLFKQVYDECIDKILYNGIKIPNKPFGIMMNIYKDKLCVFEVWNIERSINRDIELDR